MSPALVFTPDPPRAKPPRKVHSTQDLEDYYVLGLIARAGRFVLSPVKRESPPLWFRLKLRYKLGVRLDAGAVAEALDLV